MTRSITIDAPVDAVFDYALDVGRLWKVKDVALTDVDIKPGGVGTSARMFTHLSALHLEGGIECGRVQVVVSRYRPKCGTVNAIRPRSPE